MRNSVKKLVYSAMCLALCLVLPFLTGQIPEVGAMLLPMHLPVLLCGFLCGGGWGALVGFTAPLLRHLIFSMPPMPGCISMAFGFGGYGQIALTAKVALSLAVSGETIDLAAVMVIGISDQRKDFVLSGIILMGLPADDGHLGKALGADTAQDLSVAAQNAFLRGGSGKAGSKSLCIQR